MLLEKRDQFFENEFDERTPGPHTHYMHPTTTCHTMTFNRSLIVPLRLNSKTLHRVWIDMPLCMMGAHIEDPFNSIPYGRDV